MELWSLVRWARVVGFSAVCAGLAAAGHVAAGGMVHRHALAAGFAALLLPALAWTGRERTLRTILPALGAAQLFLHLLLSQVAPGHGAGRPVPAMQMEMPAGQHHAGSSGSAMLLMHLVAVIVTAWWLERGESGLCAFARTVAGWVLAPLCLLFAATVPVLPALAAVRRRRPVWRCEVLRHVLVTRGPPVGAVTPG